MFAATFLIALNVLVTASQQYEGKVLLPVPNSEITSLFGPRVDPITKRHSFHRGVDLRGKSGSPIQAIGAGKVIFAGPYAGYGYLITVQHGRGITSHYAHCEQISVHLGQVVQPGMVIGKIGSTGHSTGPHLHFELRVKGEAVDPLQLLPSLRGGG